MAFSNINLVLCFFLAINMALPTLATFYTVGDSLGWQVGVEYSTWTSDKTFVVGDKLDTPWMKLQQVTTAPALLSGNPISSDSTGETTIALKTAGTHYFISATLGDCPSGMRLAVKVEAGSASIATPSSGKERVTF